MYMHTRHLLFSFHSRECWCEYFGAGLHFPFFVCTCCNTTSCIHPKGFDGKQVRFGSPSNGAHRATYHFCERERNVITLCLREERGPNFVGISPCCWDCDWNSNVQRGDAEGRSGGQSRHCAISSTPSRKANLFKGTLEKEGEKIVSLCCHVGVVTLRPRAWSPAIAG